MRKIVLPALVLIATAVFLPSSVASVRRAEIRTLDGTGNNLLHPDWGRAGTQYLRVAPPHYADGVNAMVAGPPARYVSNRTFNDGAQTIFSGMGVYHWWCRWGKF